MEQNKEIVAAFEEKVRQDLIDFLQHKGAVDAHVPECPDVEEKWAEIGRAYLPDGTHQLYLAGMVLELNALGYHMTPLQS